MMRGIFIGLLILTCAQATAWDGRSPLKIIITANYQYNIFPKNALSQRYTKASLPYAATYIESHRNHGASGSVVVVNIGQRCERTYRALNAPLSLFRRVQEIIRYDDTLQLCQNTLSVINDPVVRDSVAAAAKERGRLITVVDADQLSVNIRNVDITGYYPDKTVADKLQQIKPALEALLDSSVICTPNGASALDMLYGDHGFSNVFHQFQLQKSGAELSLFSTKRLTDSLDAQATLRQIISLLPYDNSLVMLTMRGDILLKYLEANSHHRFGVMRSTESDLLRMLSSDDGRLQTLYAMHNLDCVAGLNYSINVRRFKSRIKVASLSDGRAFDRHKTYRIVTTEFRARKLIEQGYATTADVRVVVADYTAALVEYVLRNDHPCQPLGVVSITPETWVKAARGRTNM